MSSANRFIIPMLSEQENKVSLTVLGDIGYDFRGEEMLNLLEFYKDHLIVLDVFSFGGNPFDALAVYDYIKSNGIDVEARLWGMCGSAATIIACAADKVYIGENSFYYIHNAFNKEYGEPDQLSVQVSERMAIIYSKRTGKSIDEVKAMMDEGDNGKAFNAEEAKEVGFADEILTESKSIAARIGDTLQNHKNKKTMSFNLIEWLKGSGKDVPTNEQEAKALFEKTAEKGEGEDEDLDAVIEGLKTTVNDQISALADQVAALATKVSEIATEKKEEEGEEEKQLGELEQKMKDLAAQINSIKGRKSGGQNTIDPPPAIGDSDGDDDDENKGKIKGAVQDVLALIN